MVATFERLTVNLTGAYRRETLEGRPHLVVPCGMLPRAGVVNGSRGPLLYPEEEVGKDPSSWNGMPIVIYHPKMGGDFVSARQPAFFNSRKLGNVFNTRLDDKLRSEAWFDEARTRALAPEVYDRILNGQPVETSTGLGSEVEEVGGEFNGEKYVGIARNYKPDHLAVLPDRRGAFSVGMGGGLFANEAAASPAAAKLDKALAAAHGENGAWSGWVEDVFPDHVVFCNNGDMLSEGYTVAGDSVKLSGKPSRVRRTTEYVPADKSVSVSNHQPESRPVFDKKAHINSLIGNGFEEADRPHLEALSDDLLKKIQPKAKETPPPPAPVVGNQDDKKAAPPANASEWLAVTNAPPEVRRQVERGLKAEKDMKGALISQITANQNNPFSKEFLEGKDPEELAGLAKLAGTPEPAVGNGMFLPGRNPFAAFPGDGPHPTIGNQQLDEPLKLPVMTASN